MKDISIVIAHRGPLLGLWATIESCKLELETTAFDFEIIVVVNGERFGPSHLLHKVDCAGLCKWIHNLAPLSPPSARNLGVADSTGRVLFFFDNHVIPSRGFFTRAMAMMERDEVDQLHSVTAPNFGSTRWYEYMVNPKALAVQFWSGGPFYNATGEEPYRIAVGNHGGFCIKRSAWDEVGGYFDGFIGWAGEEPELNLKMALLGKNVWIDPQMVHYHYFQNRGYARAMFDDHYRNMMMAANIIGGQPWLKRIEKSFNLLPRVVAQGQPTKSMSTLCREAEERSSDAAAWLRSRQLFSLDEFLANMKKWNIHG